MKAGNLMLAFMWATAAVFWIQLSANSEGVAGVVIATLALAASAASAMNLHVYINKGKR
ncbi:hypothetical protein ACFO7V_16780 [Glutamicibacter bergerei]|uniref:Uncharacterized protein n=1 Tax=Glutamicibacter bergerei TaxID=256702 RepID=A0ABV9MRK3_9MICC